MSEFCECDPEPIPDEEHDNMCPACGKKISIWHSEGSKVLDEMAAAYTPDGEGQSMADLLGDPTPEVPPMNAALPWRIYKLNDCDWWVARTLEEAKTSFQATCGPMDEDEAFDDPYELTDEDMDRLKITDHDDPKAPKQTFREYLYQMKPTRPDMFASTEY